MAGLLLAAGLVFSRVPSHAFVLLDDDIHLEKNPLLNPPSWQKARAAWSAPVLGLYIPATYSLWALETAPTGKPSPKVFHAVSVGLHLINVGLVFGLLSVLGLNLWAAAAGAALFAWHPLQVETVAWASAQKDLLAGLFSLLALLFHLKDRRVPAFAAFAAALLAKPSAVFLWAIAFLLEVFWRRRPWRQALRGLAPWIALSLPVVWLTKVLQPDGNIGAVAAWWERPIVAFDTLAFYAAKLFLPWDLAPDYSRNPQNLFRSAVHYFSWTAPLLVGFLAWRRRWLPVPLLFVAAVAPVVGIVPFYFQIYSTPADRYVYLAMLAPSLMIGRLPRVAVAVVLVVCAVLSFRQTAHWQNSFHLFVHTLTVNPRSLLAHNNLGTLLEQRGYLNDALFHYESAAEIEPGSAPPLYNLARVHWLLGNQEASDAHLKAARKASKIPLHEIKSAVPVLPGESSGPSEHEPRGRG